MRDTRRFGELSSLGSSTVSLRVTRNWGFFENLSTNAKKGDTSESVHQAKIFQQRQSCNINTM